MASKKTTVKIRPAGKPSDTKIPVSDAESLKDGVVSGSLHPDFLNLAEKSPNMIFLNYKGRVVYANRLCEKIMGYSREEFYSPDFDFRCLVASESLPSIEKMFATHMQGREVETVEYKLLLKNGCKLDAVISTKLIEYNGGKAIMGIITDVSRYKIAEAEIQREYEREKKFLDIAGVIMVALDKRGRVTLINKKGCEILGCPEDKVIGKDWMSNFIPVGERARVGEVLGRMLTGQPCDLSCDESAVSCREGEDRIVRWHTTPLTDEYGSVTGLLSSGLDVTGQRQVEAALREGERRYRGLFDNAPIGIYRSTPDGRVLMANPALIKMLKYSSFAELSKLDLRKSGAYHPDTPRRLFIDQMERSSQVIGFESKWLKKDGTTLHVRESSKAIRDSAGRILYFEGTIEDVTETMAARDELGSRIRFERLITSVATRFVNLGPTDIDKGISDVLKDLGEFMGEDRSYVFLFADNGLLMDNTHEWVAAGIEPQIRNLANVEIDYFSWCMCQIKDKKLVKIPSVRNLPSEAANERKEFESEGTKSLVMIPLVCGATTIGFMGFDSVRQEKDWSEDTLSFLKIVGEIIASALERRRVEDQLRYRLAFEALMTQISAKFVNLSPEDVDAAINNALESLGRFCSVERSFVFQFSADGTWLTRTHSWDAPQVKPLPVVKPFDASVVPWVLNSLKNGEVVYIGELGMMLRGGAGKGCADVVARMREFGIESLVAIPFVLAGQVAAFLGFASSRKWCRWPDDVLSLLRVVGEIFAASIEKHKAAFALGKERQLVAALMDSMPDHIYFKDLDSRFLRINKSHAKFFKLDDPSEAIGKSDKDFFSPEHADKAYADEQEVIRTGKPLVGIEEKETWDDGTVRWVSTTKMALKDDHGKTIGTFGISRDITDRKLQEEEHRKIESRMQHAQKLESLGILSGGIAHDFNNLLMGILGNTSLALGDLRPDSSAWASVKQIETVAMRAAELTNQMLAYSGKSKFIIKPLNLAALAKEMGHLLEVSISKKAKLVYDVSDRIPLVDGDAGQLRQVVMNLITNASDAMNDKPGTITLSTGTIDCDADYLSGCYVGEDLEPGKYVCVDVRDTGCGMDAETQARIFDPFFTTKVTGRGLGLASVLGIVRAHKGALRVYSEVGKGTNFKVLFPCSATQKEEAVAVKEQKAVWKASGTMLVIDDDDVVLTVTEQIIRKVGFDVLKAPGAVTGIEEFRKNADKVLAIVLDVTLPEVTVGDVLLGLRKVRKDVPVILMSGYSEQSATEGLPAGSYQGFLQKPFNTDLLIARLREIVMKA